jgi:hypothetical protein
MKVISGTLLTRILPVVPVSLAANCIHALQINDKGTPGDQPANAGSNPAPDAPLAEPLGL